MRRYSLLLFVLIGLVAVLQPAQRVLAQDTWVCTYDFAIDDGGWTITDGQGTYISGVGYSQNFGTTYTPGGYFNYLYIRIAFGLSTTLLTSTIHYTNNEPDYSNQAHAGKRVYPSGGSDGFIDWNTWNVVPGSYTDTSTDGGTVDGFGVHMYAASRDFYVTKVVLNGSGTSPCGGGGGLSGLTMPIASGDLHEQWGMFDYQYVQDNDPEFPDGTIISDYPNTVYAYSNDPEAKVHAVADGTVVDIEPFDGTDCDGAFVIFQTLRRCRIFVPGYITQEGSDFVFNFELVNLSIVTIQDATDENITYTYWLSDATVAIGSEVVAGCVIGKTVQLKNPTGFELDSIGTGLSVGLELSKNPKAGFSFAVTPNFTPRSSLVNAGVTTVVAKDSGTPVQLYPALTEEPIESNCLAASNTNCTIENPDLKSDRSGTYPTGWGTGLTDQIPGGGVHMRYGGLLRQEGIVISPSIGYTFSIIARVTTPIESYYPITLQIGSLSTTKNITEGDYQLVTWSVGPREVSETSVSVINTVLTPEFYEVPPEVDILRACLSPDTATIAPGACYFPSHSFDADQGWIKTGDAEIRNGQAFLGDGAHIYYENAQLLTNTDDSPATYHLKALVRLNATSSYTGQVDKEVEIKYKYPETGDLVSLGVIDSALVEAEGRNTFDGNVNYEHVYTFTSDLVINESTEGTFDFGVLITDTEGFIKGMRIDSLCLTSDTEDGTFPGQGGPFIPPVIEACGVVPTPIDNNVSSWTYYHWKNLERFFNCTLMIKINQIISIMNDAWKTTRLFLRWSVVGVNRLGNWMTSVIGWLNGQFRNIAIGQVTTVYSGSGQCSDLFCVLQALINGLLTPLNNIVNALLGILGGVTGILFSVISGLVTLVVALIAQILGLLQLAQQLLATLITAYNSASPVAIDGLPSCSLDPRSSAFCMGIWVLDNTIFSGTGAAIIPMLTGILSIHLLIWVVGEIKRTVITVGSTA